MENKDSEVTITDPEGNVLDDPEALELLKKLQRGVFYLPQNRRFKKGDENYERR